MSGGGGGLDPPPYTFSIQAQPWLFPWLCKTSFYVVVVAVVLVVVDMVMLCDAFHSSPYP